MAYKLDGKRFSRLTVIEKDHTNKHGEIVWKCKCDCGNISYVTSNYLVSGHTKSCGCLATEKAKEANTTHGLSHTKLTRTYANMITRCYNPNYKYYSSYGGRGISVCSEWSGNDGITNFIKWALSNGYKDNLTLDRINVDGNYSPNNCRWATMKQQQNNRTNNTVFEYNGEKKTLSEWSDCLGVKYSKLQYWLVRKKVPISEAVKAICG